MIMHTVTGGANPHWFGQSDTGPTPAATIPSGK
jgi:hypothetical protein